jgi:hypothetical protein
VKIIRDKGFESLTIEVKIFTEKSLYHLFEVRKVFIVLTIEEVLLHKKPESLDGVEVR